MLSKPINNHKTKKNSENDETPFLKKIRETKDSANREPIMRTI